MARIGRIAIEFDNECEHLVIAERLVAYMSVFRYVRASYRRRNESSDRAAALTDVIQSVGKNALASPPLDDLTEGWRATRFRELYGQLDLVAIAIDLALRWIKDPVGSSCLQLVSRTNKRPRPGEGLPRGNPQPRRYLFLSQHDGTCPLSRVEG